MELVIYNQNEQKIKNLLKTLVNLLGPLVDSGKLGEAFALIKNIKLEDKIDFNFIELKTELVNRLEKYKDLVYSDNEMKAAKADRATLKKLYTAIDNKRKEIKALCLKPYDTFEIQIRELLTLIEFPVNQIDSGIKSYEENLKNLKKLELINFYSEEIRELKELIPFEKLFDERFLNVTFHIDEAKAKIALSIDGIRKNLQIITDLKTEFEAGIKDCFLKTLNITEALAEKTRLEQQKIKVEEMEAKRKEAKIKAQQELNEKKSEPVVQAQKEEVIQTQPETIQPPKIESLEVEKQYTVNFKVTGTFTQLKLLKEYLLNKNIKFEGVQNNG
jgi:hypothetical protein